MTDHHLTKTDRGSDEVPRTTACWFPGDTHDHDSHNHCKPTTDNGSTVTSTSFSAPQWPTASMLRDGAAGPAATTPAGTSKPSGSYPTADHLIAEPSAYDDPRYVLDFDPRATEQYTNSHSQQTYWKVDGSEARALRLPYCMGDCGLAEPTVVSPLSLFSLNLAVSDLSHRTSRSTRITSKTLRSAVTVPNYGIVSPSNGTTAPAAGAPLTKAVRVLYVLTTLGALVSVPSEIETSCSHPTPSSHERASGTI
jgi:hypothetical protein